MKHHTEDNRISSNSCGLKFGRRRHSRQSGQPQSLSHWLACLTIIVALGLGLASAQRVFGQPVFQRLKSFGLPSQAGAHPQGNLIQGIDGALYGTAIEPSTVFKINPDGTGFTALKILTRSDGAFPLAGLVQAADGTLFGTALGGGPNGGGTVFRLNPDGTGFVVLKGFAEPDGSLPQAGLLHATDGMLYGTASHGGSEGYGTIFRLNPDGSDFSVIKNFSFSDGTYPEASLIQGQDGRLYGTTGVGGSAFGGTIFALNLDGTGFVVLKNLVSSFNGGGPVAALFQGSDGTLYGTTTAGGGGGAGTVFKLNPDGSGFTVLREFSLQSNDGLIPRAALVQASDGALCGTTFRGGSTDQGTVFKLNVDGSGFAVLKSFNNSDGALPNAGLALGSDGALYGTTATRGLRDSGTVFKLNSDGTDFTVLRHFDRYAGDGGFPSTGVVEGTDGSLYGVTPSGGFGYGTIFRLNPDGTGQSLLWSFNRDDGGVHGPYGGLIQGIDGYLYGTTLSGGSRRGVVFRVRTDGTGFTILWSFAIDGSEGDNPYAALLQGTDGALYGITYSGGNGDVGVIFRINPDGTGFSVLWNFADVEDNGAYPSAPLIHGPDGALYGMTSGGGSHASGTLFKINPDGTGFSVLKSLDYNVEGGASEAALVQGPGGAFYGTTSGGGSGGYGSVFKINPDGSGFSVLKILDPSVDGGYPLSPLVVGADGALYGTTSMGGVGEGGTIFRLNPDGSNFDVIKGFDYRTEEGYAATGLMRGTDGAFYGTTSGGGYLDQGTVFRLSFSSPNTPPIVKCKNVTVSAGPDCSANASIDDGSFDPDSDDTITISQSPPGPYPLGTTLVTLTVTDNHGASASCDATVTVTLRFQGFLPPIGGADTTGGSFANPLRTFKLRGTIPVKFTASCGASQVLLGIHTLKAIHWSTQTTSDDPIDAKPTDATTTGNEFRLTGSEWHFNLDTSATGMSAGLWQLIATLSDGSQHAVWIQLK